VFRDALFTRQLDMTAAEFLAAVWPEQGPYVLATPYTPPGSTTRVYAHRTFDTIEAAAQYAEQWKHRTDLYFAVHSIKELKVWNPTKLDRKTGELGAYEVRVQSNMAAAKAFYLDLDVAPDHPQKYASQAEALKALKAFCLATHLPKPMVTSSGGGLHVYWRLTDSLESGEWKLRAHVLKQLARHHGLKADPARTSDSASVLRVAGTFNRKVPTAPRPVQVLTPGTETPPGVFQRLVQDAVTRAGTCRC
jgi:DNA primase